ncbi:unnamed protein product [Allacma fusca]|uniref:Uncharacterized protein n=1 Tax=Allacma fusca TaxID=39272 RepID=A0A8J2NKN7_9HEXA|nr:unnamed protein product [Allacma fusca]
MESSAGAGKYIRRGWRKINSRIACIFFEKKKETVDQVHSAIKDCITKAAPNRLKRSTAGDNVAISGNEGRRRDDSEDENMGSSGGSTLSD